jgi:hypothetical protein
MPTNAPQYKDQKIFMDIVCAIHAIGGLRRPWPGWYIQALF